jgi:formate dehydrogenase major subunit
VGAPGSRHGHGHDRRPCDRARRRGWQWEQDGVRTRRTLGIASLGGATLDNEENYLIKKLFTALGAIQIENQARI